MRLRRKYAIVLSVVALISMAFTQGTEPTAEEIIKKMEAKLTSPQMTAQMKITTIRPKKTKTMEVKVWQKGTTNSMTLILSPERDKGTVYLKKGSEMWNYLPNINKTVKLPMSILSQGFMGSDISGEEVMNGSALSKDFTHKKLGKDTISGKACYKIESKPKPGSSILWSKVESWVDVKDYLSMKTKIYDEDGKLLSTITSSEVKMLGGKMIPTKITIVPSGKTGYSTIVQYISMDVTTAIRDDFFTVDNMKKVK
ncbi:MAG: outer membrane lipoprotein-sorting protein [Flavobacteriales bacterium]|nr:outer membrane lipoprotein-sorting protein [Flavobacteriales bacterium]